MTDWLTDGWMDGWMERWMDGWVDKYPGRRVRNAPGKNQHGEEDGYV